MRLMRCHLKEWLILVSSRNRKVHRSHLHWDKEEWPSGWSSGCWVLDLGFFFSFWLVWIGLKSCAWKNGVCRWAKLFHIQSCLAVQKCIDKNLCQWDNPGKRRGSIPLSLTSPQCFQIQSCGQPSSVSCSRRMVHRGMMQNYPVAQRSSLVIPCSLLKLSEIIPWHKGCCIFLSAPQFGTFFGEEWRQITLRNGSCWLLRILKCRPGAVPLYLTER